MSLPVSRPIRSFRLLSTTRFVAEEPKSTLETLSTSHPTESEAAVKADVAETPVVESPAVESTPVAEAEPEPVVEAAEPDLDADAAAKADEQARSVFVGGLSWNVDNEWLKDEMLKALEVPEGVESVRIARNPMGKSRGCVSLPSACNHNSPIPISISLPVPAGRLESQTLTLVSIFFFPFPFLSSLPSFQVRFHRLRHPRARQFGLADYARR